MNGLMRWYIGRKVYIYICWCMLLALQFWVVRLNMGLSVELYDYNMNGFRNKGKLPFRVEFRKKKLVGYDVTIFHSRYICQ